MGYESKIYIVRKSRLPRDENGKVWAEKIAEFNLCKVYAISDKLTRCKKTDCFIYADDGDTPILEDRYGRELTECSLGYLAKIIRADMKKDSYWRYAPLLAMLDSIIAIPDNSKDDLLACLHYGY